MGDAGGPGRTVCRTASNGVYSLVVTAYATVCVAVLLNDSPRNETAGRNDTPSAKRSSRPGSVEWSLGSMIANVTTGTPPFTYPTSSPFVMNGTWRETVSGP